MICVDRRRFIAISAAAAVGAPARTTRANERWRGVALGARASITLSGLPPAEARAAIEAARAEIERCELLFSLYRSESAISKLNRSGCLDRPPPDFLSLLTLCDALHHRTSGRFDPTVQPLWLAEDGAAALERIGWKNVRFGTAKVVFRRPGMALTLNGIAQGHVTDRVAELLVSRGLRNVLISVGEVRAIGERAPGEPWRIGLASSEADAAEDRIRLKDRAVATSAPIEIAGKSHIVDPRTGRRASHWRRVSVLHHSAAVADGLSTAAILLGADEIARALAAFPGASAIAIDADGVRYDLGEA